VTTIVVPSVGDVTDPETIQQIHDDVVALESDVATLQTDVGKMVRVNTTTRTSNSGTFTAETVLDTVAASLVSGRTYVVTFRGHVQSSVADGYVRGRIREDNISGTERMIDQVPTTAAASQAFPLVMQFEYTASATASKTFAATAQRQVGTGNITATAAATAPTYLTVDYLSG